MVERENGSASFYFHSPENRMDDMSNFILVECLFISSFGVDPFFQISVQKIQDHVSERGQLIDASPSE